MDGPMRQAWLYSHERDGSMQRPDTEILEEVLTYSSVQCFTSEEIACFLTHASGFPFLVYLKEECPKFAVLF